MGRDTSPIKFKKREGCKLSRIGAFDGDRLRESMFANAATVVDDDVDRRRSFAASRLPRLEGERACTMRLGAAAFGTDDRAACDFQSAHSIAVRGVLTLFDRRAAARIPWIVPAKRKNAI